MTGQRRMQALVERAQGGNREAFDDLFEAYRTRLEKRIHARLGTHLRQAVDVHDILQETFLQAFRSIKSFEWRKGDAFFLWISRIAEHVISAAAGRQKRRDVIQLDFEVSADQTSPSKHMQRDERFDRLQESLKALSPDHREVILLARVEKLSIKEISQRMDRSTDAVKQLLVRALKKLKTSFGNTESFHLPPDRRLTGEEDG